MPDLLVGAVIDEDDFPTSQWDHDDTELLNLANTSYADGSPTVDVTFTAPTTGRVILIVGGGFRSAAASANRAFLSPFVWEGTSPTGTLVLDGSTATNLGVHGVGGISHASKYAHLSRRSLLTGLTPGATHFARLRVAVSGGGDADVRFREIGVYPAT